MRIKPNLEVFSLPEDTMQALAECAHLAMPESLDEIYELCCQDMECGRQDISYESDDGRVVKEAELVRCKNGLAVNFTEDYMRRRDGDSMSIADAFPSDKPRFSQRYGYDFDILRRETLRWLSGQSLILLPFGAGGVNYGYDALLICPRNAAFFACALALMQGIRETGESYTPRGLIYVAPPFRHSHFGGRQAVVHQRSDRCHEIFAYNLYPGPSAKKGVFSMLLDIGEREGWVTNHASAVRVSSAYGNRLTFMHEGASGGGKSEMLEPLRRRSDGRITLGRNIVSGEEHSLFLKDCCVLQPIADDMLLSHSAFQCGAKLQVTDGEEGWFLRVDGDKAYGSIPEYERISIHPTAPLMFFNIQASPGATCLIWEHYIEENGKPCSNPRLIIPRTQLGCAAENLPEKVDVRSFGLRMPPSTADKPDYGVMAMLQIVPPALAWLWRLVSPRGYNNPSINTGGETALESEGVGSYWPFCTGKRVTQANLLLRQLLSTPDTLNLLIPNQHIGACSVGFAGEWLVREYLTRRGGRIAPQELVPARCPLFGWELSSMRLEGQAVPMGYLHPYMQPELGILGYDAGAGLINDFFRRQLQLYLTDELDREGREIIELCMASAPVEEYLRFGGI